eukprot:1705353-Pyramimonas_sp.AAC.1
MDVPWSNYPWPLSRRTLARLHSPIGRSVARRAARALRRDEGGSGAAEPGARRFACSRRWK